jgi:hypothetical protein
LAKTLLLVLAVLAALYLGYLVIAVVLCLAIFCWFTPWK